MVSLDSENADWLREHMAGGNLPNLAALARSGLSLDVAANLLHGMVYPTLYTGQRPADHGHYYPIQWEPSEQRVTPWGRHPLSGTLFEQADLAGKRLTVLDPPECHPLQLRNGFAASGLQYQARILLHSWSTNQARTARLLERIGPAPRADEVFGQPTIADLEYLSKALLTAPARLSAVSHAVLKDDPPDCLWITFCGLHTAAHQFYDLPWIRDPETRHRLEATRLNLARDYDRLLGSLVQSLPSGSRIFVMFAKGMGRAVHWADLLPEMLRRILGQKEVNQPVSLLRRLVPRSIRRWSAAAMNDEQSMDVLARLSTPRGDWNQTRAFCLPTDFHGHIRINREGRERWGIVRDSDIEGLREEIGEGLRTFTDWNGEPCVEAIRTPAGMLGPGSSLDRFPDLFVHWRQTLSGSREGVRSPRFGEIRPSGEVFGRSGNHCPGAFAILAGGVPDPSSDSMQVEDIPATLAAGLGLPAGDLPGRSFW